jgi:hypothetical protein
MFTFKLAEYLPPFPNAMWTLARQAGVTHAVSQVPPEDLDGSVDALCDRSGCQRNTTVILLDHHLLARGEPC